MEPSSGSQVACCRSGRPRKVVDAKQIAEYRQQGLSFGKIANLMRLGDGTVRTGYPGVFQSRTDGAKTPERLFYLNTRTNEWQRGRARLQQATI
jgi:hypothetical protein